MYVSMCINIYTQISTCVCVCIFLIHRKLVFILFSFKHSMRIWQTLEETEVKQPDDFSMQRNLLNTDLKIFNVIVMLISLCIFSFPNQTKRVSACVRTCGIEHTVHTILSPLFYLIIYCSYLYLINYSFSIDKSFPIPPQTFRIMPCIPLFDSMNTLFSHLNIPFM